MTLRERILSVYEGETPDVVPYMLDLSHWFYEREKRAWDLSVGYVEPERALIETHRELGVGFYLPNLAAFVSTHDGPGVRTSVERIDSEGRSPSICWRIEAMGGAIERVRTWDPSTYSWGIDDWGIRNERDLAVWHAAMTGRRFVPHWDRWHAWNDCVGDTGVVYIPGGYSAIGQLLNLWMGVEETIFAVNDSPDLLHGVVDEVNRNNLEFVDLLCQSPAEVVVMSDNISSDVQPPSFFEEWSRAYYTEAVRRLHGAGKYVAIHIDGRLKGALAMVRETGADAADAVTPKPMGDLTAEECRMEAGPDFILSGGVSPDLWLPGAPLERFVAAVTRWLALRESGPRLIANAGDQVPPGADPDRILLMRTLVEEGGRY